MPYEHFIFPEELIYISSFYPAMSCKNKVRSGFKALNDVKYSVNSYTMNMPSILLGTAAAESMDYYNRTIKAVISVVILNLKFILVNNNISKHIAP